MKSRGRIFAGLACAIALGSGIYVFSPAVTGGGGSPPVNTVAPAVSGGTTVGSVLSTTNGTWTDNGSPTFTYQWKNASGNIAGATNSTYTLVSGDVGTSIHVTVTDTDTNGATAADSNTVGPITSSGSLGGVTAANLWITAPGDTAGSCTRSASAVAYSATTSCGSSQFLDQAVSAASPGDTIGVPGGTYAAAAKQIVTYESRLQSLSPGCDPLGTWGSVSTTNCIRIAPKQGEQPFITNAIEFHTGDIWLDGSSTGAVSSPTSRTFSFKILGYLDAEADLVSQFPDHVTATGVQTNEFVIYGSHNVRFSQMDVGPVIHDGTATNCASNPDYPGANDGAGNEFSAVESAVGGRNSVLDTSVQVDHAYIHNVNNASDPSCDPHDGGLFLHNGVNGLTLDSDVWSQNWVYDIQIQAQGDGATSTNVTIQNNWFGVGVDSIRNTGNQTTPGQRGLQFDGGVTWTNFLIRYNSFDEQGSTLCATGTDCAYSNVRFIGNTGAIPASGTAQPCGSAGVTFDKNAWVGGTCGAGDVSAASPLVVNDTIGSENFHLHGTAGSTAADNIVTPTTADYTLATDIDGDSRTAGSRDAGADER